MPIKKPASHLMAKLKLKFAKKHVSKKAGRAVDAALNLTPMIDMFVVLTIFLLMTFSTSGEILFIQKDINLPKATQTETLEEAPVIIIGGGQVVFEGKAIGKLDEIAEDENVEIADLSEALNNKKRQYMQLHSNKEFPGSIIIQGDKEVPFRVLKKVMFTCSQVGYLKLNFAVLPIGKNGGGAAKPSEA